MSDEKIPVTLTREIVDGAAALIREHGWTAGYVQSADGCFCLGGALAKTVTGSAESFWVLEPRRASETHDLVPMFDQFIEVAGIPHDEDDESYSVIWTFNDRKNQSKDSILELLDEVSRKLTPTASGSVFVTNLDLPEDVAAALFVELCETDERPSEMWARILTEYINRD